MVRVYAIGHDVRLALSTRKAFEILGHLLRNGDQRRRRAEYSLRHTQSAGPIHQPAMLGLFLDQRGIDLEQCRRGGGAGIFHGRKTPE